MTKSELVNLILMRETRAVVLMAKDMNWIKERMFANVRKRKARNACAIVAAKKRD